MFEISRKRMLVISSALAVVLALVLASALAVAPALANLPPTTCVEVIAGAELPPTANKVTLCHFTGSDGNPFVINTVSLSAWATHVDHHGDCWKFFDGSTGCAP